jgi:hypothetical protein
VTLVPAFQQYIFLVEEATRFNMWSHLYIIYFKEWKEIQKVFDISAADILLFPYFSIYCIFF